MAEDAQGSPPSLGNVLVHEGVITRGQHQSLLEIQNNTAQSMGRILVEKGYISEKTRIAVLNRTYGFELADFRNLKIDPAVAASIPLAFAQKHRLIAIGKEKNKLVVVMEDPSDTVVVDAIKHQVGMEIKPCIGATADILAILRGEPPPSAKAPVKAESRGALYRILKAVTLPFFCFGPLPVFFLLVVYNDDFLNWLLSMEVTKFDMGLYVLLGWGLWAILLYEINGLIFDREKKEEE